MDFLQQLKQELTANKTYKIALNKCYGGFSVSKEVYKFCGIEWDNFGYAFNDDRANPKLIEAIETLGSKVASGRCAKLEIIELDLSEIIQGYLYEYDGIERYSTDSNFIPILDYIGENK